MEGYLRSKWRQAISTLALCYLAYYVGSNVGNAITSHWGYWVPAIVFGAFTVAIAIVHGREFKRYRLNK